MGRTAAGSAAAPPDLRPLWHDGRGGGVVSAAAAAMLGSDNNATDDMSNATALPPVTDGGVRVIFTLDTLARARVEVTGDNIALAISRRWVMRLMLGYFHLWRRLPCAKNGYG